MNIHLPRIGLLVFLVVAIALVWLNRDQLTAEAVSAWVERSGMWGPAVSIGIYTIAPALFLPGSILTFRFFIHLTLPRCIFGTLPS